MNSDQPSQVDPPVAVERGITTLVSDSIALAMDSISHDDYDLRSTLARASIISSALYLEACANCCLDLLDLGSRFSDEVDRLPTIAKYDFFLHMKFRDRSIDRSRAEYQGYVELKTLRDSFVHPRAQHYEWLEWSENSSVSISPKSKSLGISKIPSYCYSEDAVIALRASHRFARYFFSGCARFRPSQVSALLHSEAEVPDLKDKVASCWPKSTQTWLEDNAIDLSYMRIHWHDD